MATATHHETNAEYHADFSAVSNSMKEAFIESPALYRGMYVTRTIPRKPPTPAMVLGSVTHTLLLEPERFDLEYTVAPESCRERRGKAWEMTVESAECDGTTPILSSYFQDGLRMAEEVKAHPTAWKLLSSPHGVAERSIRWKDPITGLLLKCRPDLLINDAHRPDVIDINVKTAADPTPEGFAKAVANFGYHRQEAFYGDGIEQAIGKPCHSIFVVVGNSEPYDAFVYQLAVADLTLGREQNAKALARLSECHETGRWIAPGQDEIQILELPRWARGNNE
jgi:hypothetical protein